LLVDTASASLNITLSNTSTNISTTLDVDADNEEPNLYSLELDRTQTEVLSELGIESTCKSTDVVDSALTYSWILTRPDISTVTSSDITTHIWRNSDLPVVDTAGNYILNCSVTDNANLQSSKTITIPVYGTKDKAIAITTATVAHPVKKPSLNLLIGGLILLIAIVVVIFVLLSGKKR